MRPGTERCAVLLQQGKAGPIVGAALYPVLRSATGPKKQTAG